MLLLAIGWAILVSVTVPVGLAIVRLARAEEAFDRPGDRVLVAAWSGLLIVGVALQAISLVAPLTPLAGVFAAVVTLGAALSRPGVRGDVRQLARRAEGSVLLAAAALTAGVAAFLAQRVVWTDTGLYHAGAIRWLSEHGAVPGAGLVHSRFGYSSVWYDLTAPFADGGLRVRVLAIVSGFALLLAAAQLAVTAVRALGRRGRTSDWLALIALAFVVPIASWWKQPIAPNPDFPLVLLPVVTAWALVCVQRVAPAAQPTPVDARIVPLLIAAGAASIKLNGFALVAIAGLFYVWPPGLRPARVAVAAVLVGAMLAPALITGYLASGCPLYPSTPCVDTAWSIPVDSAHDEAVAIRSYARGLGGDTQNALLSSNWIGPWLRGGQNLVLLLSLGLGLLATWRAPVHLRWPLAAGLLGVLFVLYSAPALRFALGYAGVLIAIFALRYASAAGERVPRMRARAAAVPTGGLALVLAVLGAGFLAARAVRPTAERGTVALIAPPKIEEPALTARTINDVRIYVPAGALCWSAPLPCAPSELVRSDVRLRDPGVGVGAGFERR